MFLCSWYCLLYCKCCYSVTQEEKSEKTEVLIENLFANSSYEFQVKAKPSGSKDGFVTGSWSNWGAVATHHTPQKGKTFVFWVLLMW